MTAQLSFSIERELGNRNLLQLNSEPLGFRPTVAIKETEAISFILESDVRLERVTLWAQDLELGEATGLAGTNSDGKYFYTWSSRGRERIPFLNHFGQSSITIEYIINGECFEAYSSIEVFATKINADRAEGMLGYLETKLADITKSCFSATHRRSESMPSEEKTAPVILQEIRSQISQLLAALPRFRNHKRCRLTPKSVLVHTDSASNVTQNSVIWVLSHLDSLVPTNQRSASSIKVGQRYFDLSDIETTDLYADTDVYENQVLAGYIISLSTAIREIERSAEVALVSIESDDVGITVPYGFQSFIGIRQRFGRRYYGRILSECKLLHVLCRDAARFASTELPVNRALGEMPRMTPGFVSYPHYRELFYRVVEWYRFGKLATSGERYLYGLRTIDKLYELFCLFTLIESIQQCSLRFLGGEFTKQNRGLALTWNTQPADQYVFVGALGNRIRLYYEPELIRPNKTTDHIVYVGSSQSKGLPDFVIEIADGNYCDWIVLDAKYTNPIDARSRYLPELTLKYIHGINWRGGGISPIRALYIMHPRPSSMNLDSWRSFHIEGSGIFSERPAIPALGTIEVTPINTTGQTSVGGDANQRLTQLIKRTLSVLERSY